MPSPHRTGFPNRGGRPASQRRTDVTYLDAFRPGRIPEGGFTVELTNDPINGYQTTDTLPDFSFIARSWDEAVMTAQAQWACDSAFTLNVQTRDLATVYHGIVTTTEPNVVLATSWRWYYRVRAGRGGTWSSWSSVKYVEVISVSTTAIAYIDMNVGSSTSVHSDGASYIELNVGVAEPPELDAVQYVDLNVGVLVPDYINGVQYVEINIGVTVTYGLPWAYYIELDIGTDRPEPVIWWIRPDWGREGYVFNIFGHGFGQYQNAYDGEVLIGGHLAPIAAWDRIPAVDPVPVDGPKIVQGPLESDERIDVEHGHIVAVVPPGLSPGEVSVKVRLTSG